MVGVKGGKEAKSREASIKNGRTVGVSEEGTEEGRYEGMEGVKGGRDAKSREGSIEEGIQRGKEQGGID